eukprot:scaffold490844_cov181-Attheya_sp.AAC.1
MFGTDGFGWALFAARAIPAARPLCVRDSSTDGLGISTKGTEQSRVYSVDTVRGYRTIFSNQWRASAAGSAVILSMMGPPDGKDHTQFSSCPTNSLWFSRFFEGCRLRMGQDVRQNLALEGAV